MTASFTEYLRGTHDWLWLDVSVAMDCGLCKRQSMRNTHLDAHQRLAQGSPRLFGSLASERQQMR